MPKFRILFVVIAVLILAQPVMANVGTDKLEDQLKNYMNEITLKVKSTDDPEQKRTILNETLLKIVGSIEIVEELPKLKGALIDADLQDPRPDTLILLNGREISILNGLKTTLKNGDEIVFVPVSHGG